MDDIIHMALWHTVWMCNFCSHLFPFSVSRSAFVLNLIYSGNDNWASSSWFVHSSEWRLKRHMGFFTSNKEQTIIEWMSWEPGTSVQKLIPISPVDVEILYWISGKKSKIGRTHFLGTMNVWQQIQYLVRYLSMDQSGPPADCQIDDTWQKSDRKVHVWFLKTCDEMMCQFWIFIWSWDYLFEREN